MKPFPWSFSRLNSFVTCPRSFSEITVYKRVPYEQGAEAKWGERAHKHCENYIKHGGELHTDMAPYAQQIHNALADIGYDGTGMISAEYQAALTTSRLPTEWFAKNVWLRVVLDVLRMDDATAYVVDWKMGKVKPDSKQLKLFALAVFELFPRVQTVHTRYEWLQFRQTTHASFERSEMPVMWSAFVDDLQAYVEAFRTEMWQERPSGLCKRHCGVTECKHNGRNL